MGCFKIRSEREQDDRGNSARQKIWQLKKIISEKYLNETGKFFLIGHLRGVDPVFWVRWKVTTHAKCGKF